MSIKGENWWIGEPIKVSPYRVLNVKEQWSGDLFEIIEKYNVQHLYIHDWKEDNINFLRKLNKCVYFITLCGDGIRDITALEDVYHLKILHISGDVRKFNFHKLKNLVELHVTSKYLGNFFSCTWLQKLHVDVSGVDFSAFASLLNLREIGLVSSKLNSFEGVENFKNLRALWVVGAKIPTLEGLGAAKHLTWLWINSFPNLVDIGDISQLKNLLSLTIKGCSRLRDLGPLAALSELEKLDMDDGKEFASLKPLQNLSNMRILTFWETRITDGDMKPILNFPKPQFIGFHHRRNYNMTLEEVKADYARRGILLDNDYMDYVEPKDR